MATSIHDFTLPTLTGGHIDLRDLSGKAMLIVNTASECGFTPQYAGLEQLHRRFKDRGLVVIGVPCNQFGRQEPGNADTISRFCATHFGVSFPLTAKLDVNGEQTHPLYAYLKSAAPGILGSEAIKWNFTKFLVDRNGQVVGRYAPATPPEELVGEIEALL